MTDERREGRSDGREDARKDHLASFLADAAQRQQERLERAVRAVEGLGEGSIYGTSVLLSIEQAERLLERLRRLQQAIVAPGPAYWPRGGSE